VPVSLSGSHPHRKRIKVCSPGSMPLFRDLDGGSVARSTKSCVRMEECCGDGYDASANLSQEESETSMSFGSVRDDEDAGDDIDADEDDDMDDESSFSELSYDGVAFDFGYSTRRRAARTGLPPIISYHRNRTVAVEIPDSIRQEMDRRALESELEHNKRREYEQRIPQALQEIFLRSQRGEPVDHPPPSGVAFKVFPWPNARAAATESQPDPSKGAGDMHTCGPTQPRRRESFSAASTIKDDQDFLETVRVPLVLDRWRPLARNYENQHRNEPGHHHDAHEHRPRIPLELQHVFVKAQQGHEVDPPPIRGSGLKIFDDRGPAPTRWGTHPYSHRYRHGTNEAPATTSVRHE
jgi:hypothetical protein